MRKALKTPPRAEAGQLDAGGASVQLLSLCLHMRQHSLTTWWAQGAVPQAPSPAQLFGTHGECAIASSVRVSVRRVRAPLDRANPYSRTALLWSAGVLSPADVDSKPSTGHRTRPAITTDRAFDSGPGLSPPGPVSRLRHRQLAVGLPQPARLDELGNPGKRMVSPRGQRRKDVLAGTGLRQGVLRPAHRDCWRALVDRMRAPARPR